MTTKETDVLDAADKWEKARREHHATLEEYRHLDAKWQVQSRTLASANALFSAAVALEDAVRSCPLDSSTRDNKDAAVIEAAKRWGQERAVAEWINGANSAHAEAAAETLVAAVRARRTQ